MLSADAVAEMKDSTMADVGSALTLVGRQAQTEGSAELGLKLQQSGSASSSSFSVNADSCTDTADSITSRAEIDTSAPFESVKQAAAMFGGAADWKTQRVLKMLNRFHAEKRLKQTEAELAELKKLLMATEDERQQILEDTLKARKLVEKLTVDLRSADELVNKTPSDQPQLENTKTLDPITNSSREENLETQKCASLQIFQHSEHRCSAESGENGLTNATVESFVSVDASTQATQSKDQGIMEKGKKVNNDDEEEQKKGSNFEDLETRASALDSLSQNLKSELASIKEQELKQREELYAMEASLRKAMQDLELLKSEAAKHKESRDIDTVEMRSTSEKPDAASNQEMASLLLLTEDVEKAKSVLEEATQRANDMSRTNSLQQNDLGNLKEELQCRLEEEKQAKEDLSQLTAVLQKAATEAEEMKSEVEETYRIVTKAEQDIAKYKAATRTTACKIQAATQIAEACKASEALALSRIDALSHSELGSYYCFHDTSSCVTLYVKEYNALCSQAKQAEEAANRKVASALSQVSAAEASRGKVSRKLQIANKKIMVAKEALQVALQRKDNAIQAKLMAEDHLRKRRARNTQRRKVTESGGVSKRHSASYNRIQHRKQFTHDNDDDDDQKENVPNRPLQSLAHVLSMNASLQTKLGNYRLIDHEVSAKKKFRLPRFTMPWLGRRSSL